MNYLKIYTDLINKRLKEPASFNKEKHHIIPKSIQNRDVVINLLSNYNINQLANLYYKEHYIAHCLLVKIFKNIDKYSYEKMLFAWSRMCTNNNKKHHLFKSNYCRLLSGKNNPMYGKIGANKGKKFSIEHRNKISLALKNKPKSETHRRAGALARTGLLAGINHPFYGKHLSEETKRKISESIKQNYINHPELKHKLSKIKMSNTLRLGKKHNEVTKKKISDARKGKFCGLNNPMFGYIWSEEQKIKNCESQKTRKIVLQFSLDNEFIAEYKSVREASRLTNISRSLINKCSKNEITQTHDFVFKFKEV